MRRFTDTSNFFDIGHGDIIQVGDRQYLVTGYERERRFGIDDPKFWVKRAQDMHTTEKKIIKLAFFESFEITLGGVKIRCFRDPVKEEKILTVVKGHPAFMQGISFADEKNNSVRVLDIVKGLNFFVYLDSIPLKYQAYYVKMLPGILKNLITAFEAIGLLHARGLKHGDIRNDHLIVDSDSGRYVWIDFDYDYETRENLFSLDLFGLGNVLLYTIGKGFHNLYMIKQDKALYGGLIHNLDASDFSILDKWRLMNLKKLYPFIPEELNNILLHFSRGAEIYYESIDEIIEDLKKCMPLFHAE